MRIKVGRLVLNFQFELLGKIAKFPRRNKFTRTREWRLHDCPDGEKCQCPGGGCGAGYCGRLGIQPDVDGISRSPPVKVC